MIRRSCRVVHVLGWSLVIGCASPKGTSSTATKVAVPTEYLDPSYLRDELGIPYDTTDPYVVDRAKSTAHLDAMKSKVSEAEVSSAYEAIFTAALRQYEQDYVDAPTFLQALHKAFFESVIARLETEPRSCAILYADFFKMPKSHEWVTWILFLTWSQHYPIALREVQMLNQLGDTANAQACKGKSHVVHAAADDFGILGTAAGDFGLSVLQQVVEQSRAPGCEEITSDFVYVSGYCTELAEGNWAEDFPDIAVTCGTLAGPWDEGSTFWPLRPKFEKVYNYPQEFSDIYEARSGWLFGERYLYDLHIPTLQHKMHDQLPVAPPIADWVYEEFPSRDTLTSRTSLSRSRRRFCERLETEDRFCSWLSVAVRDPGASPPYRQYRDMMIRLRHQHGFTRETDLSTYGNAGTKQ